MTAGRESNRTGAGGLALLLAVATCLGGCVTESIRTTDGLPSPARPGRAPRPVPTGLEPDRMTLVHPARAEDSDGNGYLDTIEVTAALFASSADAFIEAPGTFVFSLHPLGDRAGQATEPLASWRFEPEAAAARRARKLYGPVYIFRLDLGAAGGDRRPSMMVDLRGRFEPASADPGGAIVPSDEVRPVQVGRASGLAP